MNKIYYYLTPFFFLLVNAVTLNAQSWPTCGTQVDAAQIALETFTINEGTPAQSLPQVNRVLSITVYVVKDQTGVAGVDSASIYNAVSNLNQYFSPIALSFRICTAIRYVDNYNFNDLRHENSSDANYPLNAKDLYTLNFQKNTINLYFVSNLYDQNGSEVDGYTYMPGSTGKDYIFLSKTFIGGTTLTHQMGHFLGLYHTHENLAFGLEKVTRGAGANCTTAGDRCCDTEADPNLTGKINNCVYVGLNKDTNNEFYSPSPKNLMSFSNDNCRCVFSRAQYLRMIYALEHFRTNLR
jgi:hypothetical protein